MADQAVDIVLIGEVEVITGHVIASMTLGTHALVTPGIGAKVIDQNAFSQVLPRLGVLIVPGPMLILHELMASCVVALQTNLGYLRATEEWAFQLFEFCMIGGGYALLYIHFNGELIIHLRVFGYAHLYFWLMLSKDWACTKHQKI